MRVGFYPSGSSPEIKFLTGTYIPTLIPEKMNYLCRPGVSPLYREENPSSATIVLTVPINPSYLGLMASGLTSTPLIFSATLATVLCIYNLTLTVSMGRVTASATQAAKLPAPAFLRKKWSADSPSFFLACIIKNLF
jgi:hypothetical protein